MYDKVVLQNGISIIKFTVTSDEHIIVIHMGNRYICGSYLLHSSVLCNISFMKTKQCTD